MLDYILTEIAELFLRSQRYEQGRSKPYLFAWFIALLVLGVWVSKGIPRLNFFFLFPFLPWGLMNFLGFEATDKIALWVGHIIFIVHGFFYFTVKNPKTAYILYVILWAMLFLSVKAWHSGLTDPQSGWGV